MNAEIRNHAEFFRETIYNHTGVQLNYDEAAVHWVDGYIIRHRNFEGPKDRIAGSIGCFFGECIRETFGGEWVEHSETGHLMVKISECFSIFPFNKVIKHFENEDGDSILGLFTSIQPMLSVTLLEHLEKLPVGLTVVHTPDKVKAERNGRSNLEFTWYYKTAVTAKYDSVISEFGAFSWNGHNWVLSNYTGAPFRAKEFTDWYCCPQGKLLAGCEYADSKNWNGGNQLNAGKIKWFFIAVTADGRRVKGEAIVEKLPELLELIPPEEKTNTGLGIKNIFSKFFSR